MTRSPIPLLLLLLFSTRLPAQEPSNPTLELLNERGIKLYESQQFEAAVSVFEEALEISPDHQDVLSNLAQAWVALGLRALEVGELSRAGEAFDRSLEYRDDYYAIFGQGYLAYLRRDYDVARERFEVVRKRNPLFAKVYKVLAIIEHDQGDATRGLELLREAVKLDRKDLEARAILERWEREHEVTAGYRELSTRLFQVSYSPDLPVTVIRVFVARLGESQAVLEEELGKVLRGPLAVTFFTPDDFRRATGAHHWVGGLFDGQLKIPVEPGALEPGTARRDLERALQHELVHAFIKFIQPSCPNWLNEGIAQYFEELEPVPADSPGAIEKRRETLAKRRREIEAKILARRERRVPFSKMRANLWELTSESEARWSYLQGLGFVHFLAARQGTFRLRLLLEAAREEESIQEAFRRVYGESLEKLETTWWATITRPDPGR